LFVVFVVLAMRGNMVLGASEAEVNRSVGGGGRLVYINQALYQMDAITTKANGAAAVTKVKPGTSGGYDLPIAMAAREVLFRYNEGPHSGLEVPFRPAVTFKNGTFTVREFFRNNRHILEVDARGVQ
jgi:hypothetical protein